ncbi:hypothetical protein R1sor_024436 [Riccia sorocarpa]|uniref:Reverse transcriptase domain-containing protein n=1 Tax=Riccia sorocarpa TaxID=122646 RepID=A0ABD3GQH9_9MARC
MEAAGFDDEFVKLTKGLVEGSTLTIHVNGKFPEDIQIERGVKQGCPLTPLLFGLSSQPELIELLQQQEVEGNLQGIKISESKSSLCNLFADDTWVFVKGTHEQFQQLHATIKVYEDISGSRLNVEKSTIIPIAMETLPGWLQNTWCYVAREGEPIRYLGFPTGRKLTEDDIANFILGKVEKMLGNWTYRLLIFKGRIVVLKHILQSIPNHILACVTLTPKSYQKLERLCRKFTLGKFYFGNDKIPLFAWDELQFGRKDGGLGIPTFKLQSEAMRLGQILRMLSDAKKGWMVALGKLLQTTVSMENWPRAMRFWATEEILLARCPTRIAGARTSSGLLTSWTKAAKHLELEKTDMTITGDTNVEVYLTVKTSTKWRNYSYLTENLPCHIPAARTLIDATDVAFKGEDLGKILPFVLLLQSLWMERNTVTYAHHQTYIPIKSTVLDVQNTLRALQQKSEAESRTHKQLQKTFENLGTIIERIAGISDDTGSS